MGKTTYLLTDANTANLAELQLLKMESFERLLQELTAKVCTLTNPLDYTQLFTEKETAAKLSTSVKNLYILRKEGKIHYCQDGKIIRYSLGDILEYEESCRR
ncbi:MAG: helix-turn-helix domain-containing protein [Bacteroidota bacterium]|nr:helix-turn-helix domain-containing protein [Bacteroidota bacterium]